MTLYNHFANYECLWEQTGKVTPPTLVFEREGGVLLSKWIFWLNDEEAWTEMIIWKSEGDGSFVYQVYGRRFSGWLTEDIERIEWLEMFEDMEDNPNWVLEPLSSWCLPKLAQGKVYLRTSGDTQ